MVARQLTLLQWAQRACANEQAQLSDGYQVSEEHIEKLLKLSTGLDRAIGALARSSKLAEELAARMTPRQLLDAALEKIEAQDEPFITYVIRRLKAQRQRLTNRQYVEAETDTAVGALAALGADLETLPQGAFPEESDEV